MCPAQDDEVTIDSPPEPETLHEACSSTQIFVYASCGMMILTGTVILVVTEVTPVVIANYSHTGEIMLRATGGVAGGALIVIGGVFGALQSCRDVRTVT